MIGRPHPILATIANWYLLSAIGGALVATICALVQRTPPILWSVPIALLLLITAISYQIRSRHVAWLSPGEVVVGRAIGDGGQKQWLNPWCANRWALNTVLFTAILISGNTWDGLFEGRLYPAGKIVVNAILLGVLWSGLIVAGKGKTAGAGVVVSYFVFLGTTLAISPALAERTPVEFNRTLGGVLLSWAAVSLVIVVVHHRLRERRTARTGMNPREGSS